jgi:hypothetical protein
MFRHTTPLLFLAIAAGFAQAEETPVRVQQKDGNFEVAGLPQAGLEKLKKAAPTVEQWQEIFVVRVGTGAADLPAVAGSYRIDGGVIRFKPRFPPVPGVVYHATFRPSRLPGHAASEKGVAIRYEEPVKPPAAPTVVSQVYPSRKQLPENQLKFYLHFSAPMSRGEAYRNIRLLDAAGKAVELPFLELDEELWDPAGKRFTLFFDPGRIKRGLKPREEMGPALSEGKTYTLVIDARWKDAAGFPLKETFRKSFKVLAPDDTPPDPKDWKLEAPAAGGAAPLTLRFPKPLDHALLHRLLWITDARGQRLDGSIRVSDQETRWQFTPRQPWQGGAYDLVIDTALEDLAGNSIGRPFEVDLFRKVEPLKSKTVKRGFQVRD